MADWKKRTRAVHGGIRRSQYGEVSEAIFLTQGFVYESAEAAEARFVECGPEEFIYARYGNPTTAMFEDPSAVTPWLARWRATSPDAGAMDAVNPAYVPRNLLVEEALTAATEGDLDPFHRLLAVVREPFVERPGLERYALPGPADPMYRTFCGT